MLFCKECVTKSPWLYFGVINDAAYFTHALARLVCFVTKVRKMDVYEADPHTQDRNLAQAGGASGESVS